MESSERGLEGQIAWFELLAKSGLGRSWTEGSGWGVSTGLSSNSDNGIVLDRASMQDHRAVRSLVRAVQHEGSPASLLLSEAVPATDLEFLVELGLTPENSGNEMAKTIDSRPTMRSPAGVEFVEVADGDVLRQGLRALGEGWFDEAELERYAICYEALGLNAVCRVRHWVAYRANRAIAMATSFRFDRCVLLMHCGVVEKERRRGVGAALTNLRLAAAFADGARSAVLSPTPDGYQLHNKLGFVLRRCQPDRWFYLPTEPKY